MTISTKDRPSAIPWPPVLLAGTIGSALAFDRWVVPVPVPFAELDLVRGVGWCALAVAVALTGWAIHGFRRHRTTIRPDQAASTLMTDGAFAFSRNPLYLAETLALAGAALAFNRLSLLLAATVFALAVDRLAIRAEEAHLERRFGDAYRAYCARVGRWL